MYSKIKFFIALLCVVNSFVITVTANDGVAVANPESTLERSAYLMPPRCTDKYCNEFCEIVGFDSGNCVDGRCLCAKKQDVAVANAESTFDRSGYLMPPRCTDKYCNEFCEIVGYDSGSCVDGRCLCAKKQGVAVANAESTFDRSAHLMPPRCTDKYCNEFCEIVGYDSGNCVEGQCLCVKRQDVAVANAESTFDRSGYLMPPRCTDKYCNEFCEIVGYDSGSCVDGRCQFGVYFAVYVAVANAESTFDRSAHLMPPRCTDKYCNEFCEIVGYDSGNCVDGRCLCAKRQDPSIPDGNIPDEIEE